MADEWEDESFWIYVENNGLYPPERDTWRQGVEALLRNEDFEGKNKGKKVLDNGGGTGRLADIVNSRGAETYVTDISGPLLEEASKKAPVAKASSYSLPFGDETFDYVTSFMVLHVLENPEEAIEESWRVLKPAGKFYVGIVHPGAPKWDEDGFCYNDLSTYHWTEKRSWVFNLTDGTCFTKSYIHRPRGFYEEGFKKFFRIEQMLEPENSAHLDKKKYAQREYLFFELSKPSV